jgi:hypothetical protein
VTQAKTFLPDNYLTSTMRALEEYVKDGFGLDGTDSDPYEISMNYPDVTEMAKTRMPLERTIIHFEIDDNRYVMTGMGDQVFDAHYEVVPGSDPIQETIIEHEGRCHEIDLDVGVWASAETGGPTSRMQAREVLDTLFSGSGAYRACHAATDGIEILSLRGGRNLIDLINDIPIFRTVDMTLRIRVYARFKKFPKPVVEEIGQAYEILIDENLTITGQSGETEPV